jgi:hypothetical protein
LTILGNCGNCFGYGTWCRGSGPALRLSWSDPRPRRNCVARERNSTITGVSDQCSDYYELGAPNKTWPGLGGSSEGFISDAYFKVPAFIKKIRPYYWISGGSLNKLDERLRLSNSRQSRIKNCMADSSSRNENASVPAVTRDSLVAESPPGYPNTRIWQSWLPIRASTRANSIAIANF